MGVAIGDVQVLVVFEAFAKQLCAHRWHATGEEPPTVVVRPAADTVRPGGPWDDARVDTWALRAGRVEVGLGVVVQAIEPDLLVVLTLALPCVVFLVGANMGDPDIVATRAIRILGDLRFGLFTHRYPKMWG